MAYYYSAGTQQNTNGTANTDLLLLNIHSVTGSRAYLQKVYGGGYPAGTPTDVQVRLRIQRTTVLAGAGTGITPTPHVADVPAASAVYTTLPTGGTLNVIPPIQLAYNGRGNAMWAAFNQDEACGMLGATAPNSELVVNSQAGAVSMPVVLTLTHSE